MLSVIMQSAVMLCVIMLIVIMLIVVMLRVIMLSVIMLSVAMLSVVMLSVILLSVVMLSVIMLSFIMLSVIMQSVFLLSVVMLSVVMASVAMLSVIMLSVILLSVVMLSVLMLCRYAECCLIIVVAPQTTLVLTQLRRLLRKLVFERFYDWVEIYAALNLLVGFFWCCDIQHDDTKPNGTKYECLEKDIRILCSRFSPTACKLKCNHLQIKTLLN